MALHTSGSISLNQIRNEFGGGGALWLSSYYRGAGRVPNSPKNYSISTGGRIAHSMFYGASKELSSEELAQEAARGMSAFSRRSANTNPEYNTMTESQPYSGHLWSNVNWPVHKWSPGNFDFRWNFNNMGWAPTEDQCTVIILTGGNREIGASTIASVTNVYGQAVGFNHLFHSRNSATGRKYCISMYRVHCDRREVASIVTRNAGGGGDTVLSGAVHIIPGGSWTILNYKINLTNATRTIYHGDVVMAASGQPYYGGWLNPTITTHDSQANGQHWYGAGWTGAVYGSSTRGWAVADVRLTELGYYSYVGGPRANNAGPDNIGMIRLRKLSAGQTVQQFDNLQGNLQVIANTTAAFLLPNGNEGNMYSHLTTTAHILNTDGDVADEMPVGINYSINHPSHEGRMLNNKFVVAVKESVIDSYPDPTQFGSYATPPFSFSATVTLTTAGGRALTSSFSGTARGYRSTINYNNDAGGA